MTPAPSDLPCSVFIAFALEDEALSRELLTHLALQERQGILRVTHARMIPPGAAVREALDAHVRSARVIVLLVSASYNASPECAHMEALALERRAAGEAEVIPVLLRACDWRSAEFANRAVLPPDGRPVMSWPDRDDAWRLVVSALHDLVEPSRPRVNPPAQSRGSRSQRGARSWRTIVLGGLTSLLIAAGLTAYSLGTRNAGDGGSKEESRGGRPRAALLSFRALRRSADGTSLAVLEPMGVVRTGEHFACFVTVDLPAHVYILQILEGGELRLLFPSEEDRADVLPGRETRVPTDPGEWFGVDDATGVEHLYVVASVQPLERASRELMQLVKEARTSPASPVAGSTSGTGSTLTTAADRTFLQKKGITRVKIDAGSTALFQGATGEDGVGVLHFPLRHE